MSDIKYRKSISSKTKTVVNPDTFWEFIYKFYKEFNYELDEIDIKSEYERRFRIRFIYAHQPTRVAQIEFDGYESIIKYKLNNCNDFELAFKRETKYIEQNA